MGTGNITALSTECTSQRLPHYVVDRLPCMQRVGALSPRFRSPEKEKEKEERERERGERRERGEKEERERGREREREREREGILTELVVKLVSWVQ